GVPPSPSPVRAWPPAPARGRARRAEDLLRRSCAHRAVLHPWARLRQVSTAGKTAARVQNPRRGARVAIVRARWNDEITRALAQASPFGVLTCETIEQARARSSPEHNVGREAMEAALELVTLRHAMASSRARSSRSAATARSRPTRAKRSRSPGNR